MASKDYFSLLIILFQSIFIAAGLSGQALIKQNSVSEHSEWCDYASGTRFGDVVKLGDLNNDRL